MFHGLESDRRKYLCELSNDFESFMYSNNFPQKYGYDIEAQRKFNTTFSIAHVESSTLSEEDAYEIFLKTEENLWKIKEELARDNSKLRRMELFYGEVDSFIEENRREYEEARRMADNNQGEHRLIAFHDKLVFKNILNTYNFFLNPSNEITSLYNSGIDEETITLIHSLATYRMDELFEGYIYDYYSYHSGIIRADNNVMVEGQYVEDFQNIHSVLRRVQRHSSVGQINEVASNLFRIHYQLYSQHLFYNGNKRTCRLLEAILESSYKTFHGASASYGYYLLGSEYNNKLIDFCIKNKNEGAWVDFSYIALLLSLLHEQYQFFRLYIKNYYLGAGLQEELIYLIPMKHSFSEEDIMRTIHNNSRVPFIAEYIEKNFKSLDDVYNYIVSFLRKEVKFNEEDQCFKFGETCYYFQVSKTIDNINSIIQNIEEIGVHLFPIGELEKYYHNYNIK